MPLELSPVKLRILGALVEKELATPDYYPLTLSALQNACNQKTSREPVTGYTETEVREGVEALLEQSLARERNPAGSRVAKYAHRLSDSLGLSFGFTRAELSVLAVLMLRGPQTPGELRSRTERLRAPNTAFDVDDVLASLANHERGPWVLQLPREPGRREARWGHLLGTDDTAIRTSLAAEDPPPSAPAPAEFGASVSEQPAALESSDEPDPLAVRVSELEDMVLELQARIEALEER